MPFGICASQLSIVRPNMRNGIPRRRKCAAMESPYGPAPTMAISNMGLKPNSSSRSSRHLAVAQVPSRMVPDGYLTGNWVTIRDVDNRCVYIDIHGRSIGRLENTYYL